MAGDRRPMCYYGAKEIGAAIREDHRNILALIENEGLPVFRRNGKGKYRALPADLEEWLVAQREKYKK